MRTMLTFSIGLALCAAAFTIHAGPPLICHPYNIGTAQSLPWGHGHDEVGFDNPDPNYNTKQLTSDTLKILDAGAPVLVVCLARPELREVRRNHIPKDFGRRGMILVAKHIADAGNSARPNCGRDGVWRGLWRGHPG